MNRTFYLLLATATLAISPAHTQEAGVKLPYAACITEEAFKKFDDIRRSGDREALEKYYMASALAGVCLPLKVGQRVFKEGLGQGFAIIKIRPKGMFQSYFTYDMVVE
jgi:hypothetical protein